MSFPDQAPITLKRLLSLWLPLAMTWFVMNLEVPVLQGAIARFPAVEANLAAFGVFLAVIYLLESPIFSIISAATALVTDELHYRRLRNFTFALSGLLTAILLLLQIPFVFHAVAHGILALPDEIASLFGWCLLAGLPTPFCVAYRRFYQGLMIRHHQNNLVGLGTVIRMSTLVLSVAALAFNTDLPGCVVAALGSSCGIVVEAISARVLARVAVARIGQSAPEAETMSYGGIAAFYFPLALNSVVIMAVHPMLTFFMARGPQPMESLAVFPILGGLCFQFMCVLNGLHELILSSIGQAHEHREQLQRFGGRVLLGIMISLALVLFTPAAPFVFLHLYGLSAELTAFALARVGWLAPLPLLFYWGLWQRAVLTHRRRTVPTTVASVVEVGAICGVMAALLHAGPVSGATAGLIARNVGRFLGNLSLLRPYRKELAVVEGGEAGFPAKR